jgi:hypothetical protein
MRVNDVAGDLWQVLGYGGGRGEVRRTAGAQPQLHELQAGTYTCPLFSST